MGTGKGRQYYTTQEVHDTLIRIGGGNYSKGLRIAAMNHKALVEALGNALCRMESDLEQIEGEWGVGRSLESLEKVGELTEEIVETRALLARIEGEGK